MKEQIRNGLEKIIGFSKNIGKVIKKNAKIGILLAGATISSFNNNCLGFGYEPGKLKISNYVYDNNFFWRPFNILHYPGTSEGYDYGYDFAYYPIYNLETKIISTNNLIPEYEELYTEARPLDSKTPVNLELSLYSSSGNVTINSKNELRCSFRSWHGQMLDFGKKPITLWERTIIDPNSDPNDPNNYALSFMADVRDANDKSDFYWDGTWTAVIPLPDVNNPGSGAIYKKLQIKFDTFPGDFNLRSRVDMQDFAYLAQDWGKTDANSIADISGPYGIPDKNVDVYDLALFTRDYLKDADDPNTW